MEASDNSLNSSLGILDLGDTRMDILNDMDAVLSRDNDFEKTLQKLHKAGSQSLRNLTTFMEMDLSKVNFGLSYTTNDNQERSCSSRVDSMLLKPSEETHIDATSTFSKDIENDSVFLKPWAATNGQKVKSSTPKDKLAFQNARTSFRSFSQEGFEDLDKKKDYACNGTKRTVSLSDESHMRNIFKGSSNASIRESMFLPSADAFDLLDQDEKDFRENHRFEISRLSGISTIPPDFSHVSAQSNDVYFRIRSEKLGALNRGQSTQRPSFGLVIKSPRNNVTEQTVEIMEGDASRTKVPDPKKSCGSNNPASKDIAITTIQRGDSSNILNHQYAKHTIPIPLGNDVAITSIQSGDSNTQTHQYIQQQSLVSNNQISQQSLGVYIPVKEGMSSCCYSGPPSLHYVPYSWGDQGMGNYYPQMCQAPVYRGPFSSVPKMPSSNHPLTTSQEFQKLIIPTELPEKVVCVYDALEFEIAINNPSYQNATCVIKVLNVAILDSIAVKLDVMANCKFVLPGTIEIKGGTTHIAMIKCSFKLPGKYRVYLEVNVDSSHSVPTATAITIESEEAKIGMFSKSNGGSCLNFGEICSNTTVVPQFIRVVNNGRATVPVKLAINTLSHKSDNFIFPPELLSQIISSTAHVWLDVLPTFIVVRLDGQSTLDIPVTVDIGHPLVDNEEHIIASVQLLLKGNSFFHTKNLMKIRAYLNPHSITRPKVKTVPVPTLPKHIPLQSCNQPVDKETKHSNDTSFVLIPSKKALYFQGVEVGDSQGKILTLTNRSQTTSFIVQISLISCVGQAQYFIRDGENECSRLHDVVLEPKQKKDILLVFKPTTISPSGCSLQVKGSSVNSGIQKQDFLIPVCGYGGASHVTMLHPTPNSLRRAYLWITPLSKTPNEFRVTLSNTGSRAAFVTILPIKDGKIELDKRIKLNMKAFIIHPGQTQEVKVRVELSTTDCIFNFYQSISFFCADEQLRQFLRNKLSACDSGDRRMYEGPGLLKAVNILQPFQGEEEVPQDDLYKVFKKDVAKVFYDSIKVYDVLMSTEVSACEEEDDSLFTVSSLGCSYGSLLNSTLLPRDKSLPVIGMSPPIRGTKTNRQMYSNIAT